MYRGPGLDANPAQTGRRGIQGEQVNARIDLRELAARESEQVEWKEHVADEEDVVATIVAFANDLANLGGGYVVCGAREGKDEHGFQAVTMIGLSSSRLKTVEGKVLALCRDKVEPPLTPIVEEIPTVEADRRVLVFVVPASRRAHMLRSRQGATAYYVRIGRETIEARNGIYRELLLRKGEVEPWDRRSAARASVDEVDLIALRDALQRMGVFDPGRGVDDPSRPSPITRTWICRAWRVSAGGRPLNGGAGSNRRA